MAKNIMVIGGGPGGYIAAIRSNRFFCINLCVIILNRLPQSTPLAKAGFYLHTRHLTNILNAIEIHWVIQRQPKHTVIDRNRQHFILLCQWTRNFFYGSYIHRFIV